MNIIEAMEQRKSVRSYKNEEVEEKVISQLKESLGKTAGSLVKGNVRYEVVTGFCKEAKTGFLYGMAKINAPAMIVGIYEEEEDLIEIGFRLEKEVLELTMKGYGTCFLGTYDEETLRSYCKLSDKEKIGIVVVFGKVNEKSKFRNGALRSIAGSTKRKNYKEIMLNADNYQEADKMVTMVKHAIMAPSANNVQPVRVKVEEGKALFYLKESKYLVDLGIFVAHFYLYSKEICDKVEITKNTTGQEEIEGMKPAVMMSW